VFGREALDERGGAEALARSAGDRRRVCRGFAVGRGRGRCLLLAVRRSGGSDRLVGRFRGRIALGTDFGLRRDSSAGLGDGLRSGRLGRSGSRAVFLADGGDGGADGDGLALIDEGFGQDAGVGGFDLERDLVGLDLGDRVAGFHLFADGLQPAEQRPLFHSVAHLGHDDRRHPYFSR
jgi:hypothetical protein